MLMYVALAAVYLAPLAATPYLPAFDLPHHLAIVDALAKMNRADSPYARDFVVGWKLAPFAVHYALLRALSSLVPVPVAAKMLVGAVVLTLPLATARLLDVCDVDRVFALGAFPLAYSMPLHYGLIGFVVALPPLVWMMAAACDEEAWRARPFRAGVSLAALSLLTFMSHLEAWAMGGAAAVLALLIGRIPWRGRALGVAALIPATFGCALFLLRTAGDSRFSSEPSFARGVIVERLRELSEHGVATDVWSRVRGLPIHLLRGFNDGSDLVAARIFFAAVGVFVAARLVLWMAGRTTGPGRPRPVAGAIAAALLAYLGLPHHLPHAASIYPRFAVILALLLLAASRIQLPSLPRLAAGAITTLVVLGVASYGVLLIRHYSAFGRELQDFRDVATVSPAGLASGGLVFDPESSVMNIGGIFSGIPVYYVFERPALRSSTWLYYCADPQVPCRARDPGRVPPLPFFSYPWLFDARRGLEDLELMFVRGGPPAQKIFGPEVRRVRLIAERGQWRVFARWPSTARALDDQMRVGNPQQVVTDRGGGTGEHAPHQP